MQFYINFWEYGVPTSKILFSKCYDTQEEAITAVDTYNKQNIANRWTDVCTWAGGPFLLES